MYKRLTILSVIIVVALCGLSALGYHAIEKWAEGLEGARLGEFAEVAEQIRQDVKRKLDRFIQAEQRRKYTDYLYYYVPENIVGVQQQLPLLRSPLGDQMSNSLAYGYFQVEPDGRVITPHYQEDQPPAADQEELARQAKLLFSNIRDNVLPSVASTSGTLGLKDVAPEEAERNEALSPAQSVSGVERRRQIAEGSPKAKSARSRAYPIESLQQKMQEPQIITQQRLLVESNTAQGAQSQLPQPAPREQTSADVQTARVGEQAAPTQTESSYEFQRAPGEQAEERSQAAFWEAGQQVQAGSVPDEGAGPAQRDFSDTVQIRVEPFVPLVVPTKSGEPSIFGGQIFLLRHVQIEDRHLLQGFQFNESKLIAGVEESAGRFMREGMAFQLPQVPGTDRIPDDQVAYTAVLDFGFGDLVLSLREIDPGWIAKRIVGLRHIYFAIIAIVMAAVTLSLASLWQNVRAQARLTQKKDDFISAVSHELRTPLTSIRMYSEMLEKNWVKSQDKVAEYYRSMRQESERLSRLVENVLDFSRLQRGRKRYAFELGDLSRCISEVVEMMRPYAQQHGFALRTEFASLSETSFDKDAVAQIVVNLIDNAVKYARSAQDKTITVRTEREQRFTLIEVEDHGPGIPHRQRKKIFEQFYGSGAEPTHPGRGPNQSPATGTGLGLALVKRFAEAHDGFVEVHSARPSGAIFKVALSASL
jgi:signal transduction histidine kinase